ncbi:uncharacterized protein LOC128128084 [Lactuca sativa]|uniref:uncharacterized protein LOC128128084 n=1 Tax=Lactuca sativa TaxID=4236 RepID=UPI0022AEDCAD|nr:uncharacterized protein LOC128128084 [Lactuca sativa]
MDPTLFRRSNGKHLMLVQIYVDDIIFGSTDSSMVQDFANLMINHFQMSMNRESSFLLGLQVKQTNQGIFIHQEKYILKYTFKASARFQSKPSASKSANDFGSSSSTTPDGGSNSKRQEDDATTKPGPSNHPFFSLVSSTTLRI